MKDDASQGAATPGAVGIVGVGAMGGAMARCLLRKGYRVIVRDIVATRVDALAALGAVAAASAADVARQADLVLTVVVDSEQTDDVLFGPAGIAAGAARGAACDEARRRGHRQWRRPPAILSGTSCDCIKHEGCPV